MNAGRLSGLRQSSQSGDGAESQIHHVLRIRIEMSRATERDFISVVMAHEYENGSVVLKTTWKCQETDNTKSK